MKFGALPLDQAAGAVLAHSMGLPDGRLAKGQMLTTAHIARLKAAGLTHVTVARLDDTDLDEDTAARQIGATLASPGLTLAEAHSGRVNVIAAETGLVLLNTQAIEAANTVNEALTLATLPDRAWVQSGAMVATVKIIPYGVPAEQAAAVVQALGHQAIRLIPARIKTARLIMTRTPGFKDSLLDKAETVTRTRLARLGVTLNEVQVVAHDRDALANALTEGVDDLTLMLGASATSDRQDVIPAAIIAAGGRVTRFGMPVDPGNLLVLGERNGAPVVGLPGCARSPALNGADWVLERIVAGQVPDDGEFARMGVGGLLKEIPERRQPRRAVKNTPPKIEVILLAAGASRRMGGQDKLLRLVGDEPLLRRSARAMTGPGVARVSVVLPPEATARADALSGLDVTIIAAPDWQEGMAASLRAGIRAVQPDTTAVIVALADMPDVTHDHLSRLIAVHTADPNAQICRSVAADGTPGHPVLFARRFFENLAVLEGDRGARDILGQVPDLVVDVPTPGQGAVTDLDTPEAWENWEAARP